MDLDKPLDEIIDTKRAERKASRGRGRGGARGGAPAAAAGRGGASRGGAASSGPVRNKHSGAAAAASAAGPAASKPVIPLMADGSKIQVSNLPLDVTENQIRDLFTQTVGPVTRVLLSYDKNGKSTGSASIEFKRPNDAQNAYKSYNTRLVDGNRAMKVEIIYDPARAPPPPLNSRIAPAPVVSPTAVTASQRGNAGAERGATRGGRGARGGRGRGRGGKRGDERPKPTEADLDAEMEDYQSKLAP